MSKIIHELRRNVWRLAAATLIPVLAFAAAPEEPKVTFIELGSVNCVPCRMMQPVMKQAEEKYRGQVKVVFHDVWTPQGQPYGRQYKIVGIPTQVFLDKDGKEWLFTVFLR
jgi:thiol-disulfide isomerase/thioredoxin